MLSQPTCVGLRYGHPSPSVAGISRLHRRRSLAVGVATPARARLSVNTAGINPPLPTSLDGAHLAAEPTPQHPASVKRSTGGTGMSTGCPSAAACACALGPTNPPRITLAAEPSGFRWWGFLPHFAVTRSGIRTRGRSSAACAAPSLPPRRSPTKRAQGTLPGLRSTAWPRWIIGAAALDQ